MDPLILAAPAAYLFGFPLVILVSQKVNPDPRLDALDPAMWPPAVGQTMSRVEHDLYALGFSIVGRFVLPNAMPNLSTMVTMLVNYKSGDKSMITAIWANTNEFRSLKTHYTEFSTRFEDGHCFDTLNSPTLPSFQVGPLDVKTRAPQLQGAAELYALHRYVMRKHGAQGRKVVYDAKDATSYLRRIWRESFEEQVGFGRFRFNGREFVPTVKGAYLMAWGQMWPMTMWIRARMNAQSRAIVSEWKSAGQSGASAFSEAAFDESRVKIQPEAPLPAQAQGSPIPSPF